MITKNYVFVFFLACFSVIFAQETPVAAATNDTTAAPNSEEKTPAVVEPAPASSQSTESAPVSLWDIPTNPAPATSDSTPEPKPEQVPPVQPVAPAPEPAPIAAEPAKQETQPVVNNWNDTWGTETSSSSSIVAVTDTSAKEPLPNGRLDNVLHGNAYNNVRNEAAAANVNGELSIPHRMSGRNFAYFEPIDQEGVVSFGNNLTYFFAFDNSNDLGLIMAGLALPYFGISLQTAIDMSWNYTDNDDTGIEETTKDTEAGTMVAGAISTKIAGIDIAVNVAYDHPETEKYSSSEGVEISDDIWDLGGKFTLARKGESISWAFGVGVLRFNSNSKETQQAYFTRNNQNYISTIVTNTIDSAARVEIVPEFNLGGAVLSHPRGRVFMGLNTAFPIIMYDRIKGVCSRHNEYAVSMTPNIIGEAALGQYVIVFGSASHQWDLIRYRDSYINNVSVKKAEIASGITTANVGMRIDYELASLELTFTKMFIRNPFGSFSSEDDFATSIGMFINF